MLWHCLGCLIYYFSNSYMDLISIDFSDFTSPFTSSYSLISFCFDWGDISNTRTVFHRLSKHLEFHQTTPLCVVCSTLFSVFGYPDETLSLVLDILLPDFTAFQAEPVNVIGNVIFLQAKTSDVPPKRQPSMKSTKFCLLQKLGKQPC